MDTRNDISFSVLTVSEVQIYLTVSEVARRAGLSPNTVKAYTKIPGRLPEPDALTGRVKGWLPETIDAWIERRTR